MRYVIAYDISSDHRRTQVANLLKGWGRRVQKSVFECEVSPEELRGLAADLKGLLVIPGDRCHLYRICGECLPKRVVLGRDLEDEWKETIVM